MDTTLIPKITQGILDSCKPQFTESVFSLYKSDFARFVIAGDSISKAINHYPTGRTQVNVLKWFDNFWVYMEISFVPVENEFPRTFVSVSLFQGEEAEENKTQLFRAEWDSHENNKHHAQPHWHLYPYKYHFKVYEDFEAFNEMKNEDFEAVIKEDKLKIVDLRRIHFAMNAEWAKKLSAIHPLSDLDALKNWLEGLFADIKYQIRHALRE